MGVTAHHPIHHAFVYLLGVLTAPSPAVTPALTPPPHASGGGGGTLGLLVVLGVVAYGIGYSISIRVHPFKACRRCRGSGRHRGAFFSNSFRACDRCGGNGREYRAFADAPFGQNEHKRGGRR